MRCDHERLAGQCEQCAFDDAVRRGAIAAGREQYPPATDPRRIAETDLDLVTGPATTVHVKAGDPIPLDLLEPDDVDDQDDLNEPAADAGAAAELAKSPT